MAFSLALNRAGSSQRWKVKIRDRERLEPPHVSIIRGLGTWRLNLRTGRFLDAYPDPADVPPDLVRFVLEQMPLLRAAWDRMYPDNPVDSNDDP